MDIIKKNKALLALLALFMLFLIYLNQTSPLLYWDENTYLSNARSHISEAKYNEEFRFPLLGWTIATLWLITGESILAAKLLVILFTTASAYLFYLICREFLDKRESLIALLLFCTNYLILYWGFRAYTDLPGLALVLLGFYLLLKSKDFKIFVLAGMSLGAAFLMRFTNGLFFFVATLVLVYEFARKPTAGQANKVLSMGLGFLIAATPWLIYNKARYGTFLWNLIQQYNITKIQQVQPATAQLIYFVIAFGPLSILALVGAYHTLKARQGKMYIPVLFTAAYLVYILFFVNLKLDRYLIAVMPFIILLGYTGLKGLSYSKKTKRNILIIVVLFALAVSGIKTATLVIEGDCSKTGAIQQSIDFVEEKTTGEDVIISNIWPWFGYHNNREVHSLWTTNTRKYKERYNARYIILHENKGELFNKTLIEEYSGANLEKQIKACDGNVSIYSLS